ncbi:accessory Sec system glycosyltransferase GtfA [Lactococcus lactis]|uniref:accessory Sec system glycosyltransferase GtfA n=1 Tax=Lactococcus lactis TaxID=1358 RepID=UPI000BFA908B|nr:accessory Sec system glycosyltransferase GtfA [Lactococcus lactis]PFG79263.1 accessory Sec system glycosyltransferase GtfA [Lactococcus lactis]
MTIYNFNLGIGWASSGVEYAQAYRANIFRKNKQEAKFIFTDLFHENIQAMTQNIGFEDHEIIWLYQYYTNLKIRPSSYTVEELESQFSSSPSDTKRTLGMITYTFLSVNSQMNVFLTKDGQFVSKTETIINGNLVKRDYYSYVKVFSEYFKPVDHQARLFQRRFFNEDGSVAYEELNNGKESLYLFEDRTIYSFEALLADFMKQLQLTTQDLVIIDRSSTIGPEILRGRGVSKVGVVIHADHFSEPETNDERILWNNHYEYVFKNSKHIDFFITATPLQKERLASQFKKYKNENLKIYTIPVGSLDKLRDTRKKRKGSALITASRLATEKHIDWIIEAVVKARLTIRDLSLDIYGEGGEYVYLSTLINEKKASQFIRLMGQKDLKDIYKYYPTYISGSTSEGFGLTLMEAVGSGLGMIGFDVRYGNPTFIKEGKNGFLVPYEKNNAKANIDHLYQGILKTFMCKQTRDKNAFRVQSYEVAKPYLTEIIQRKWLELEKEVLHD